MKNIVFISKNESFIKYIKKIYLSGENIHVFINSKVVEELNNDIGNLFEKYIILTDEIPLHYNKILVLDYSKQSNHLLFSILEKYIDIDPQKKIKIFLFFNLKGYNNLVFFEYHSMQYSELKFLLRQYIIFSYILMYFFDDDNGILRNINNIIFDSLNLMMCIHLLKNNLFQFNNKFKKEFGFILKNNIKRKVFIKNIVNKEQFLLSVNNDFIEDIEMINASDDSGHDEKYYLHNVYKIENKGNNLIGFLHVFYLVEDRAVVYDSLRLITKSLEYSYNAYLILNIKLEVFFYNKKFLEFFDIKNIEKKIVSLDRKEKIFSIIKYILESFQKEKKNTFLIKKGENFYKCNIRLIETLDGRLTHILLIFNDITEEKLIQKKLIDKQKMLKNTQLQLIQREKLASIGELSAGIAHELNNPICFISNNFEILKKYFFSLKEYLSFLEENIKISSCCSFEGLEKKKNELNIDFIMEDIDNLFNESKDGINRVIDIVSNLRRFSRVDLEEKFQKYDIREALDSTITVAYNSIKYHAEVKKEYKKNLPLVECIPNQINQVFLNIIINAVHAIRSQNRKDKGLITIKTYSDKQYVYCEISDDGPGIPDDIKEKIFVPFFTTKKAGEGTGLGLSICYDIVVNKHGGGLICKSEVGKGTTFIIKLPIKREKQ